MPSRKRHRYSLDGGRSFVGIRFLSVELFETMVEYLGSCAVHVDATESGETLFVDIVWDVM